MKARAWEGWGQGRAGGISQKVTHVEQFPFLFLVCLHIYTLHTFYILCVYNKRFFTISIKQILLLDRILGISQTALCILYLYLNKRNFKSISQVKYCIFCFEIVN